MILEGKVFKFGDDVDTDVIIPARYLTTGDPKELAKYCMEDIDPEFSKRVKEGDIIVAGNNFGCGSSREHAPISIKGAGVAIVIAKSFARIFYRNAVNIGLPIIECREAADAIQSGHRVSVDIDTGVITNLDTNQEFLGIPFPPFMQGIVKAGGLLEFIKAGGMNSV
jgi:3-isopropylmalate/(R)-2-methylmalate dehydratase small subunit